MKQLNILKVTGGNWQQQKGPTPSLKHLTRLLNCILFNASYACYQNIRLCCECVLHGMPKLVEDCDDLAATQASQMSVSHCSIPPRCKRMLSDNMNSQAMNSSRSLLHRHQRRLPIHRRRLVGNNDGDWQPHLLSRAGKKCRLSHYAVHPGASTLLCGRGRHAPALSVVLKILWRLPNKTSPLSSDTYAAHYQF